jgi:hypothetical protein
LLHHLVKELPECPSGIKGPGHSLSSCPPHLFFACLNHRVWK